MERQIKVVARYLYGRDYYVEVESEDSAIAVRDYWLCRQGSAKKMFLFSCTHADEAAAERRIIDEIPEAIRTFESVDTAVRYA